MIFYPSERIALFIDGSNLFAAARTLGLELGRQVREAAGDRLQVI